MNIRISEDELAGIFREDSDYMVQLAQVPLAVQSLRALADRLEEAYDEED